MKRLAMALTALFVGVLCVAPAEAKHSLTDTWQISEGDETFTLNHDHNSGPCFKYYRFHYRGVTISGGGLLRYNQCTQRVDMRVEYGHGFIFRPIPNGMYVGRRTGENQFRIDGVRLDGRTKTLHFRR